MLSSSANKSVSISYTSSTSSVTGVTVNSASVRSNGGVDSTVIPPRLIFNLATDGTAVVNLGTVSVGGGAAGTIPTIGLTVRSGPAVASATGAVFFISGNTLYAMLGPWGSTPVAIYGGIPNSSISMGQLSTNPLGTIVGNFDNGDQWFPLIYTSLGVGTTVRTQLKKAALGIASSTAVTNAGNLLMVQSTVGGGSQPLLYTAGTATAVASGSYRGIGMAVNVNGSPLLMNTGAIYSLSTGGDTTLVSGLVSPVCFGVNHASGAIYALEFNGGTNRVTTLTPNY